MKALLLFESRPLCFPVKPSGTSISGISNPFHSGKADSLWANCALSVSDEFPDMEAQPRFQVGWVTLGIFPDLSGPLLCVHLQKKDKNVYSKAKTGTQGKGKKVLCKTPVPWLRSRRQCLLRLVGYRKSISNKKIRNSHLKESGLTQPACLFQGELCNVRG